MKLGFSVVRAASVAALSVSVVIATACSGGDFRSRTGGKDGGLSDTGGGKGSGGDAGVADGSSGSPAGDAEAGGASSSGGAPGSGGRGGAAGHGARTGSGGTDAAGGSPGSGGAANTGGDMATGGTVSTGGATGAGGATGKHSQYARDYDQSCQYDTNCTLVHEGEDVCLCDQCPNAAINSSTENTSQWDADRKALGCIALPCSLQPPCAAMVASCANGSCYARKPLVIDAKNYDQTCASSSDCVAIPLGEVCSACQCSQGAVSKKGYDQYLHDKESVTCSPPPVACDCVAQGVPVCSIAGTAQTGTCVMSTLATN